MFSNDKHAKAEELLKQGKVTEAIETYGQALKDSPNDPVIYSDRGAAYLHLNDEVNCMKDFDKAIELQPDYSYRYACRAFAKAHFKKIDAAIEDYNKAIDLDPEDAIAHNNLGILLEQKGYADEAKKRFERADKLSKQEDHLLEVMDDLEDKPREKHKMIDPTEEEPNHGSTADEMKKIFTSKKQFREFLSFIKNGFKLK